MKRHTRQEAKRLGISTCYGSACVKHPELDGFRRVSGACVECAKITLNKSRLNNPERTRTQKKKDTLKLMAKPGYREKKNEGSVKYRKANKDKCRATIAAWSARNPDKVKTYAKKTKTVNSGNINALTVKRRLAKLHRTPKWVGSEEQWLIKQAYQLAALRTKLFGFAWHVDHIIPLQGKTVSGLHAPHNLQVIPGIENVRKANYFELAT
jgi:hypothetical protein